MLWKVFSVFAALILGAGVYFSIENKKVLKAEKDLAKRHVADLNSMTERLKQGEESKIRKDKELLDSKKQLEDVKTQVTKIQSDTELESGKVQVNQRNLDEVTKQLTQLEDLIRKVGDLPRLQAQIKELGVQKTTADSAVANQKQQLALAQDRITKIEGEMVRLDDVDKRQRSGEVEPGFTARITQPYLSFGFVILNKGNLGGMFAKANLQVKRGNNIIAKLTVRDVEQAMSVADLVPGSMAQGETIRSGDLVVAAPRPPAPPAPLPSAETPTPTPGAAPEPFAPPTPGMAPPTPAPTTPPASDPFAAPGAGMAPAAPAAPATPPATPPASSDPFAPPPAGGTPPAPAPGATPAPAAGATPAPATSDPFAPPPGATPPVPPAPPAAK